MARRIWTRFGRPGVDSFASKENARCSLSFSVKGAPAGPGRPGPRLAGQTALCIPATGPDPADIGEDQAPRSHSVAGGAGVGHVEVGDTSSVTTLLGPSPRAGTRGGRWGTRFSTPTRGP